MSPAAYSRRTPPAAPALLAVGLAIVVAAWLIPVSLKSISSGLLATAGRGTPSLAAFGRDLVDAEKIGPASFFLAAARGTDDPRAPALGRALDDFCKRQPSLVPWGGWDPFLDPLFNLRQPSGRAASTPVLTFFVPEKAREALRAYLSNSGSLGVQAVLRTREVPATGRFIPANRPGGQPLDAVILLAALLYQGEHLSPSLQREVRSLAEEAVARKDLGDLEDFYMNLLSLGRRFDWAQLSELLRTTKNVKTVGEYAHLARVAPDQMPFLYSAALLTGSADRVAVYLIDFGKAGGEDLRLALADGQGAVRLLLERQVPVNRSAVPALGAVGALVLEQPRLMLVIKYLGYFVGMFFVLRGLDRWIISPVDAPGGARQHARSGALAVVLSALLVVATEPFLLKAIPASEYRLQIGMPLLASALSPPVSAALKSPPTMQTSTLVSIAVFAALQVVMYFICLRKIADIEAGDMPPLLKLRLMENEENLFDSGLYVGMMGTAAALVLQVLGVIEPNLLAAYSSNLFGIICVAIVKIRHVRGYRRRLILLAQGSQPSVGSPARAS